MTSRDVLLAVLLFFALSTPAVAQDREARRQVQFGIDVAQRGLWREAIYRWERALELDPSYAQAHNNLGIAFEHQGELDKARLAYERALELAPGNLFIQQNYELFLEIRERASSTEGE